MDFSVRDLSLPRISIIVGHTGSGKTEFAVNLALALAEHCPRPVLADLDVVNPYYRSRERRDLLKEKGIELIASSQACLDADLPSMPAQLNAVFDDPSLTAILDVGGSVQGARVLARYRPRILAQSQGVYFVLNGCRPATSTLEGALISMEGISQIMGLPVVGIINNSHLGCETTVETILDGIALAEALSLETGVPILCHSAEAHLACQLPPQSSPVFPMTRYMKHPWEL